MEKYLPVLGVVAWIVTALGVAFVLPYFLNSTSGTQMSRYADTPKQDEGLKGS